ncbi:MAG: ATP-binding cassette domain-containing protein [Oscillospiraceae bacterium]|nr:ATP-binding cassette domain-containing protein [Oscillospiraceae bacterium]
MNQYIISAKNIKKKYGGKTVFCNASLNVKRGEIYGLIGKNGSGKTTLLRILAGLIKDYNGEVLISDNISGCKSKISAVINTPSLFLNMSAFHNMKEQAILSGIRDEGRIEQALSTVGLSECGSNDVKSFSLGMMQRLKLAMALLESPDILILDEPSNGLDPDGISELRLLLLDLNRTYGITILISSHILSELENVASCIGILQSGEIVKELSMSDILQSGESLENIYLQYTKGARNNV